MRRILFLIVFQLFIVNCFSQVLVTNTLCENLTNPIGIDGKSPRFSWQLSSDKRNVKQTAYEIKVMTGQEIVWTSKVTSDQSVLVSYGGKDLVSGKKYSWQVRVWDNNGKASPWSTA